MGARADQQGRPLKPPGRVRRTPRVNRFVRTGLIALTCVMVVVTVLGVGVWTWRSTPTDPSADEPVHANPIRRRLVMVEGKQIPLPAGDWYLAAHVVPEDRASDRAGDRAAVSQVLLRVRDRRVDAAVLVQANRFGRPSIWGLAPGCKRTLFADRRILYASDHDGACAYAGFVDGTVSAANDAVDPAWRRAQRDAVDRGWNLPASWMMVSYRISDPMDAMQVRYLFHPWSGDDAKMPVSTTVRRVFGERLVAWMDESWPAIALGFRGRLDRAGDNGGDGSIIGDWTNVNGGWPRVPGNGADHPPARPTPAPGARAVTAPVMESLTDFGVAWLYLGNVAAAGTLSALAAVARGAVSVTHDAVWSMIASPSVPDLALPGVGAETALPR